MHPLPGSSGENERLSSFGHRESQQPQEHDLGWEIVVGIVIPAVAMMIVQYIARRDSDAETSFKLQALHIAVKALQATARTVGQVAINVENYYNATVESLH